VEAPLAAQLTHVPGQKLREVSIEWQIALQYMDVYQVGTFNNQVTRGNARVTGYLYRFHRLYSVRGTIGMNERVNV
jgi:hypothetical protein